jgi:tripartite-type tricarboxylate transporter receptor subunit TctC
LLAFACGAQCATLPLAGERAYPAKSIRLVVPFPPGASTDSIGRFLAQGMGEAFGVSVIVDNRGGAGGVIGTSITARALPDGYTLLLGTLGTLAINPSLYPTMDHDPARDLAPITKLATVPNVLVVNAGVPIYSVQELIRFARRRPGELNYGSAGNGSSLHLGAELFKLRTGVSMVHVPYRGGAPALSDLLAHHIHMMFNSVPLALPYVVNGRLRALAVTGGRRAALLPDVPTMRETGVAGFEFTNWFALLGPARLPHRVSDWLSRQVAALLAHGETRERLLGIGAEPVTGSPGDLAGLIREETRRWREVIRSAGITAD